MCLPLQQQERCRVWRAGVPCVPSGWSGCIGGLQRITGGAQWGCLATMLSLCIEGCLCSIAAVWCSSEGMRHAGTGVGLCIMAVGSQLLGPVLTCVCMGQQDRPGFPGGDSVSQQRWAGGASRLPPAPCGDLQWLGAAGSCESSLVDAKCGMAVGQACCLCS